MLSIRAKVDQVLAAAAQAYQAQYGDTTLCQLHKEGRVTGGLKYSEGQMVALYAVKRLLNKPGQPQDISLPLVVALRDEWRQELKSQQQQESQSTHWIAYRQGGVDALEAILTVVEASQSARMEINQL